MHDPVKPKVSVGLDCIFFSCAYCPVFVFLTCDLSHGSIELIAEADYMSTTGYQALQDQTANSPNWVLSEIFLTSDLVSIFLF